MCPDNSHVQSEEQLLERAAALARSGHIGRAAHMLRERLILDPYDLSLRSTLAGIYRDGGHADQAARYMLGFGEYDPQATEAYLRWLAATGANEEQLRHLSVIPDEIPIPAEALIRQKQIRTAEIVSDPWEVMGWVCGGLFAVCAVVTVFVVYLVVIFGGAFARTVAIAGTGATAVAAILASAGVGVSCWRNGSRRAALVFGAISLVSLAISITAFAALST